MTYIPVGTRLTYTAQIHTSIFNITQTPSDVIIKLKQDLLNLPGLEELDIENSSATAATLGNPTIALILLNNGVDHGSETDIQSIIDGTLQNEGVQVVSSNISQIQLPNNPDEGNGQVIDTGAKPTQQAPSTNTNAGLKLPNLSGGSIAGISVTIIIIAIVALILLLPGGFARSLRAVRR